MGIPIIGAIVDTIKGPLKDLSETRKLKREAQAKVIVAKAEAEAMKLKAQGELALKQAEHVANWEVTQAQQAVTSWKDEYLTVLITIPLAITFLLPVAAAFVGADAMVLRVQSAVAEGWNQLDTAPVWYRNLVIAAFAAVFGLRGLTKFWK